MFHRQSRTSWNTSVSTLHLQHHCSHSEKHTSPRGRIQRCLFARRHGWPGELREWQTPRTKSSFWWGSLGLTQLRASGTRSLDTPCVCAVILPPLWSFLICIFLMSSVFLFVSSHKCVPCAQRTQTTVNHLFRKAPTRRWQSPWSWRNWAERQWFEFLALSGKIYVERMQ